jgi:hypothetical protein
LLVQEIEQLAPSRFLCLFLELLAFFLTAGLAASLSSSPVVPASISPTSLLHQNLCAAPVLVVAL